MGIAYYHPDASEKTLMAELMQCLERETHFKKINLDMIVPHIHPDNNFENASSMWMVYIAIIFCVLLIIGCAMELIFRRKAKLKPEEDHNVDKGHTNSKYSDPM